MNTDAQTKQKPRGDPHFLGNCSFQETLSPMILELRIPKGLQGRFSDVRILKGLRARPWDRGSQCSSRSSRQDTASPCRVSRFCKAPGGLALHVTSPVIPVNGKLTRDKRKRARLAFES